MSTTSTTPQPFTPAQMNKAEPAQWLALLKQFATDLRCSSPAFLTEDMGADQTVTAQIALQERVRTLQGAQWWDIPPIIKVPVVLPRGGGWSLTLPLKKGDEGLLIFCDTCFDLWWHNGQNNAPKAANASAPSGTQQQLEVRRHYHHDCGFLPGMWSQPNVLPSYSTSSMQLRSDDGSTVIDLATAAVTITAAKLVVNTTGDVDLTAGGNVNIQGKNFLTHVHTGVQSGGSNSGPVF